MRITATLLGILVCGLGCMAASHTSRDVKVLNPEAGITLAGTLSVPDGTPRGSLVLATGSGLQNRDEELMGHRPFKVIAEFLADHGYAVLRMDDRGFGESEGNGEEATTGDFVTDIASGLALVDSVFPEVPTGVLGHSEGGTIAIRLAPNPKCDFIVTLGAPAWSGDSIVMSQSRAVATAMTGSWAAEQTQRKLLDLAKSSAPSPMARVGMMMEMKKNLGEAADLPQVQSALGAQIDAMLSPWYRSFLRYDPAEDIKNVSKPWIALNGSLDHQVLPANLETVKALNPKAKTILMPDHNHLFQVCRTGLPQEYVSIAEDISEQTLNTILENLELLIQK